MNLFMEVYVALLINAVMVPHRDSVVDEAQPIKTRDTPCRSVDFLFFKL
jgi:hypothetical protein